MRNYQQEEFVQPVMTMKGDGNMQIVPGDIIKPVVEEATTEDRLLELFSKRYRQFNIVDAEWEQAGSSLNKSIDEALKVPLLKDAVVCLVTKYTEYIGHDRYVILTETELKEKSFYSDKIALIQVYLKSAKEQHERIACEIAVQRMLTMRRLTLLVSSFCRDLQDVLTNGNYIERKQIRLPTMSNVKGRNTQFPAIYANVLTAKGEAYLEELANANTHAKKVVAADKILILCFQKK